MADSKDRRSSSVADLAAQSITRRRLMQGGAALGLTGLSGGPSPVSRLLGARG